MSWKKQKSSTSPSERRSVLVFGGGILALLTVALVILATLRWMNTRDEARQRQAKADKGRTVEVMEAVTSPPTRDIDIIGEARPYLTDNIYARVSGYVISVLFDKGDRVKAGQVLATIESPETDKAYLAALADAQNKRRIAIRYRALLKRRLVAPQDTEIAVATADIAEQTLATQRVLKSYETVRAPFDGIITSRLIDPGNLIQNATNSQSGSQLLTTLSHTDTLRIYAFVDQRDAAFVHPGDPAEIRLEERPDFHLQARVTRISGELDPKARKMLTEIDIANEDQKIVSGSFVRVRIQVQAPRELTLPVKALVMKGEQSFVPLVTAQNRIHFQPVEVLSNDGERLRIGSGIAEGDHVALDVGGSILEGTRIQPRPMSAEIHQAPPYPGAPASSQRPPVQQAGRQGAPPEGVHGP